MTREEQAVAALQLTNEFLKTHWVASTIDVAIFRRLADAVTAALARYDEAGEAAQRARECPCSCHEESSVGTCEDCDYKHRTAPQEDSPDSVPPALAAFAARGYVRENRHDAPQEPETPRLITDHSFVSCGDSRFCSLDNQGLCHQPVKGPNGGWIACRQPSAAHAPTKKEQ